MPELLKPRAAMPLSVLVEDDVLTIRIGTGLLAFATQGSDTWADGWRVVDLTAFAKDVAAELEQEEEDGTTPIHRMLDTAAEAALEAGSLGIEEGSVERGIALARTAMEPAPAALPAHIVEISGQPHRMDSKGRWTPQSLFKPQDVLQDDLVREMIVEAKAVSDGLTAFRTRALLRTGEFQALLDQEYGVARGGAKGNVTLTTLDGTQKMEVRVNDTISFGPELQQAKAIIDECLSEWSTDARPEVRAIILRAFNVEKEGQVNRSELFMLMRLDIEDERWQRAMKAIKDSIQVDGSKTFVRFSERETADGRWRTISLDIAQA